VPDLLKNNENISSAIVQVHHNKENSPLYITFHTYWKKLEIGMVGYTEGGRMLEFLFIDYYNWFEENKSKYYTKDFFSNQMSNYYQYDEFCIGCWLLRQITNAKNST
jgi:hypothetical protein